MLLLGGVFVPGLTRATVSAGIVLVYLSFAAFLRPFDGPLGRYGAEAQQAARAKQVWVPVNFKASTEEFRLLLPGADIHGYPAQRGLTISELKERFPFFAIQLPMEVTNSPAGVRIVGRRLNLSSRHSADQIKEMIQGKVFQHLFHQELLVETTAASAAPPQHPDDDGHH
jgi:hypothetical protein